MEKLNRREALGVLGAGLGLGALAELGSLDLTAQSQPRAPVFERGAVIRTLLRDIDPQTLDGPVLFHEHLSIRYPLTKALAEQAGRPVPASFTDDVDLMVDETKAAGKDGVRMIVDGGHPDMDRDLPALTRIALESGVHIVASGGF